MFSFHRPKVYRSSTGCCICKAKSSSSRFTDSKKYEDDFLECFQLSAPRQGEICNACVLLVKRWKKLPAGSDRNWRHVVDARAGPGTKSMTKFKSKNKKLCDSGEKRAKKKKEFDREYSPALSDKSDGMQDMEMSEMDFLSEHSRSGPSSRNGSPGNSDCEEQETTNGSRRHKGQARRRENIPEVSSFIDLEYWTKEKICCGMIFRGKNGELLMDQRFLNPCIARQQICKLRSKKDQVDTNEVVNTKVYSDNSSDSGYDESSNPGATADNAYKKEVQHVSISQINGQASNNVN